MTKFTTRLLLIALLAGSLAACAEKADPADTPTVTTAAETVFVEDEGNGREFAKDNLPDDLNFGGRKVRILSRGGDNDTKFEFYCEEMYGDVVNDSIYQRNSKVCERLNVEMDVILDQGATRHSNIAGTIRNSVSAGSDDYDIVANAIYGSIPLTTENLLADLQLVEHLDFDQPWWNQTFLEMTQWNGKNYLALGELSQSMISGAFCMFFNKDMFATYHADQPSLYDTVLDGQWTLDKMIEYCAIYTDLNGNSRADEGDVFGHYFTNTLTLGADSFFGGSQMHLVDKEDGIFVYNGTGERMAMFGEKLHKLLFEDNNTLRLAYNNDTILKTLSENKTIFTTWMLSGINLLRDMENDFGILPMPKLDESQEEYTTYVHDGSTSFGIPSTKTDTEMEGAFLEAMAAETYRKVTPAYFEIALKNKYSRDNETSIMLDMLVESVELDYAYIYGQLLGKPIDVIRNLLAGSSACQQTISTMASKEKPIMKSMEKLEQAYDRMME